MGFVSVKPGGVMTRLTLRAPETHAQVTAAFGDRFHRRQQFSSRVRLDDIPARAGGQRGFDQLRRLMLADEKNLYIRILSEDAAGRVDPALAREADVEQDQIILS